MIENSKSEGFVELIIDYDDGSQEVRSFKNTVLVAGRNALAKSLAHDYGDSYEFYITRMMFGTNGTDDGVAKYVRDSREGLFGPALLSKSVTGQVDPDIPTQVIFTAIITKDEANGTEEDPVTLNEMALRMANGDLYSMATFADISKTNIMQLTWNWRISFI